MGLCIKILLLFKVAYQHAPFRHERRAVTHQTDAPEFGINGITQFPRNSLLKQNHINFLKPRLVLQQYSR